MASLLMVATLPGRTHGLGLITEPLLSDLHLDRLAYANLNLWATVLGAAFCFPAGALLDRTGVRWISAGLCLLLAVAVWQVGVFAGSVMTLFLLLLATRAFGQSALSVASITAVGKEARARTGQAMAIYSVLLSVGFAIGFGLVGWAVRDLGWRTAWKLVAVAVALMAPLALWLLHGQARPAGTRTPSGEGGHSLNAALKTPAFWVFAGAGAFFNLVSSGLGLFNEAVLAERGFDRGTFHTFLVVTTLLSLAGQGLCGWLTARWSLRQLTAVSLLMYAMGLAAIPLIRHPLHLWGAALLLGVSGGMIIVIFFTVWSAAFGQAHLGRIQGAAQVCTVLSSALGPVLFAKCREATGSYAPVLGVLAGVVLVNAIVAWRVTVPQPATGRA